MTLPADVAPFTPLALDALVPRLARVRGTLSGPAATVTVRDVRQDSRQVVPGDLFVAREGARSCGVDFARDAVARGAVAVVVARGTDPGDLGVPVVEVDDVRLALALAAEEVQGRPSQQLGVVGITGTNGKTTSAWLAEYAVRGAGGHPARLGTLGYRCGSVVVDSPLTTPEADQISRYLAEARVAGATHFLMEVSSHALSQARVDALSFAVAAFTNLTQDHLDYHRTMDEYAANKARLFLELAPRVAVINVDDRFGRRLAARFSGNVLRVSRDDQADVRAVSHRQTAAGLHAEIALPSGRVELESRLVGTHNLDNLLLVLGITEALELDAGRVVAALGEAPGIPGRLERCDEPGDDVVVLVDYAHTPDALGRALEAVRELTSGRLICVFGCGGDRDPAKRPLMGEAVGRAADVAIVSNDNPRTEDPEEIARQIEIGLRRTGLGYDVVLDRAQAIERAVLGARGGDVVLIAGKGHETYQIMGTERRDFDDRVAARRALEQRRERQVG